MSELYRYPCMHCGGAVMAGECCEAHRPRPGHFAICVICRDVSVFNDDLSLRRPTDQDLVSMDLRLLSELQAGMDRFEESLADLVAKIIMEAEHEVSQNGG